MRMGRLPLNTLLTLALIGLGIGLMAQDILLTGVAGGVVAAVLLLDLLVFLPVRRDVRRIRDRVREAAESGRTPNGWLDLAFSATSELWRDLILLLRQRAEQHAELGAELARTRAVLAQLPDPVLLVDRNRMVTQANTAAEELFGRHVVGRDLGAAIRVPAVLAAADAVLAGADARFIDFDTSVPHERSLRARINLIDTTETVALIALTDFTTVKRAEQLRADFVANASHELRTPLSTVVGFIETLEGPAADDEAARRRFLPIMRQQAARMARLVDDLLSLSRIELNEHLPPRGQVDLLAVLRTVTQALDLKAGARGMRLLLSCTIAQPYAVGDAEELAQVFQEPDR